METNRKYLVAVALLTVLAVAFGAVGTFAPPLPESELTPVVPQQGSEAGSTAHFQNPPTFDSGWVNITDKRGQYFNITHDLNCDDVLVDIAGKAWEGGSVHQKYLGLTGIVGIAGWTKTYGTLEHYDVGYSLVQTDDGGYAIAGTTRNLYTFESDVFLVKTDSIGNHQWNKTYGTPGWEEAYSMVQTADGGYALAGTTFSFETDSADFWLVKTDSAGNAQWNKTYGGADGDHAYSVVQTGDGGYAIAGELYISIVGRDFWLVKTDLAGNHEWNKTYDTGEDDHVRSVVQTSDGGYAIAGYTWVGAAFDAWLVKTNSTGDVEWSNTYGDGTTKHDYAYSVVQTADGGYAFAGRTESAGAGGSDVYVVKTYSDGNGTWWNTFGGTDNDEGQSLVQTDDGGYAIAGTTGIIPMEETDVFLVKTDVEGEFGLARTGSTANTLTFYRGRNDVEWNYVRVRIWLIKEPTWIYGDINMDGVVDAKDLYILCRNYGQTFSLLSLSGIIAIAGIHTVKKRKKQPK